MKTLILTGIVLIFLGIAGFIYKGITYTEKDQIADLGPIEIEAEDEKTIPIPELLSGIAVVGGIVLVAVGSSKRKK
jgi:hypothetical protein